MWFMGLQAYLYMVNGIMMLIFLSGSADILWPFLLSDVICMFLKSEVAEEGLDLTSAERQKKMLLSGIKKFIIYFTV